MGYICFRMHPAKVAGSWRMCPSKLSAKRNSRSLGHLRRLLSRGAGADGFLTMYSPASWWHPEGRQKMVRRLETRGFPALYGWLFFTLTCDAAKFADETAAFEAGKDRVRRVIYQLRRAGYPIRRYFFKLELHESGYPHWHLGVDCRRYIPNDDVAAAWGLGFTQTLRVRGHDWRYLFKYVVKGSGEIPAWVLDYPGRIRVFQTSSGFFGCGGARRDVPEDLLLEVERTETAVVTLRGKFERWERKALLRFRGEIMRVVVVELVRPWRETLLSMVEHGRPVIDAYNIPVDHKDIREKTRIWKTTNRLKGWSCGAAQSLPPKLGRASLLNLTNRTRL